MPIASEDSPREITASAIYPSITDLFSSDTTSTASSYQPPILPILTLDVIFAQDGPVRGHPITGWIFGRDRSFHEFAAFSTQTAKGQGQPQ